MSYLQQCGYVGYCCSAYYLAYSLLEAAMCTFNAVLMVALVYPLLVS